MKGLQFTVQHFQAKQNLLVSYIHINVTLKASRPKHRPWGRHTIPLSVPFTFKGKKISLGIRKADY